MSRTNEVAAGVTVESDGGLYIGVQVRQKLNVGYNDRVRVTIPRSDEPDITVNGCLNSANRIRVGRETFRELDGSTDETPGSSKKVDAIVEPQSRTWDEANGLTDVRWNGNEVLPVKDI